MKRPAAAALAVAEPPAAARRSGAARNAAAPLRALKNSRGETIEPAAVTASEAKGGFGRVLDLAMQGGAVVITKHDVPRAVLLSVETFNALSTASDTKLDALAGEFDALLARMQTPKARRGMKAAFAASGRQLGQAAAAAARRRG